MTINKTAIAAGKKYERDLLDHFRDQGFDVERLRLNGVEDEGDLLLRTAHRYVIEAKREKGFHLGTWIKEATYEAANYGHHRKIETPRFLVVHHARGKSISQSYVTTTLEEWVSWLT